MSADETFILAPPTVSVRFSLEPVRSALNSMMLLDQAEDLSGLGEWVKRTYTALSPERRRTNVIVFKMLFDVWDLKGDLSDFAAFLNDLAQRQPLEMQADVVRMYHEKCCKADPTIDISPEEMITNKAAFLDAVEQAYVKHYAEKGMEFDLSLYSEAHDYIANPQHMKDVIVEHLTYLWENFVRQEWQRNLPMLQESIEAFSQLDYRGQTALEVTRLVTGRDLAGYWEDLDNAQNIVFVPTAHIGPYVSIFPEETRVLLMFGARVPKGMNRSPALSRSELLVRLSALADDTRLTILELLTRHDELCAQDIINLLDLSQSSASRHLRQLTATGYLVERRREVAKCYSLNMDRVDDTLNALKLFVRGRANSQ